MKRALCCALFTLLFSAAFAQAPLGSALSAASGVLKQVAPQPGPPPADVQKNPFEPSGFPPLPSKTGELPPPRDYGPDEKFMRIIQMGTPTELGNHIHVEDGFHVRYRGYDIYGDTLDGDRDTLIFTATGHVKLIGSTAAVTGDRVTINFRDNTFVSEKMEVDLKPTFFPQGQVIDDVYVNGLAAHGGGRETWADYTYITTCNLPEPHFEIFAKHTDLRPGKRIILRGVTLYILKKKIFSIPYLSIPLDNRNNHIVPEVGDDPVAGLYIKTWIPIPMHGNNEALTARVDEYQKLGTGLGADLAYQNRRMNGTAEVYTITGHSNEQDLNVQHDQHFGRNDLSINATFANNDYLQAPGSTLLSLRSQLTMPQRNGSFDQLAFNESSNTFSGFKSLQQSLTLNDSRIWNPLLRSTLSLAYTDNNSSTGGLQNGSYDSKMLDINFDANDDLKKATAEFQYQRNMPIGAHSQALFGLEDLTPQLTLKSDSSRLFGQKWGQQFPFTTDVAYAQMGAPSFDGTGISNISRGLFDFNYMKPDHPDRRFDWQLNTRFQQGVYSDNTAQYVTGIDTGTRYNLGFDTAFDVHYSYLQQHGYTPLDQDRTGQTNLLTTDVSFRPIRSVLLAAQSGYDFLAYQEGLTPYQDVGLRAEWHPVNYFQLRALSTYDTTLKTLSNIQVDMAYKPGATFISAGFRYDGQQHTIGEWDLFIDALKIGRLKASMVLDYDGYAHTFTAQHFAFTYDLHCAEAVLQVLNNPSGFRSGTQVAFFIRLKAFPFATPFGVGTQGQAVGGGFGRTTF